MPWNDHISRDPEVMSGKPCIRGTRVSVEFVLEQLSNGWTPEDLAENHGLTLEQVRAAQGFAAAWLRMDEQALRTG